LRFDPGTPLVTPHGPGRGHLLLAGAATWQPHLRSAQTVQLPDFTELVERVGPSVVNIRTTEKRSNGEMDPNVPNIEEFFRRFGIPMPNRPGPRAQPNPVVATKSRSSVAWVRASSSAPTATS
jgi:S1-C subfamily serine protease